MNGIANKQEALPMKLHKTRLIVKNLGPMKDSLMETESFSKSKKNELK